MKIKELISKTFLILTLFLICSSCTSYAVAPELSNNGKDKDDSPNYDLRDSDAESGNLTVQGNQDEGLPELGSGYKPTVSLGTAQEKVEIILGALTVIGVIIVVIAIALIGFNTILGSASEKADYQVKIIGILIGGIMMVSGSTIAQVIIKFAENIN